MLPVKEGAARGGNLALLQWVLASDKSDNCYDVPGITEAAARAGHVHVMEEAAGTSTAVASGDVEVCLRYARHMVTVD